jgi:hypothetical protein
VAEQAGAFSVHGGDVTASAGWTSQSGRAVRASGAPNASSSASAPSVMAVILILPRRRTLQP